MSTNMASVSMMIGYVKCMINYPSLMASQGATRENPGIKKLIPMEIS